MNKKKLAYFTELFRAGKFEQMEAEATEIVRRNPKDGMAWKALGAAMKKQGKEGIAASRKAVELLPNDWQALYNLGVELQKDGQSAEAVDCYQRALQINPKDAATYNNLANALVTVGRHYDALPCNYRAIQLDPKMAEAHLNLGNNLIRMNQYAKACDHFEKALEIEPDLAPAHSNLIFTLDLMISETTESQQYARRVWAETYTDDLKGEPNTNDPDPARRLRIGYVSGDFRLHSATRVFGAMIMEFDHANFDVYCYCNNEKKDDSYTEMLKEGATKWRHITELSAREAVKLIRDDEIDILVDLSGHSGMNRLDVFAYHPAPVQITAWGYATGTGLKQMDYFFADPIAVPPEDRRYYSEEVIDLPCVATAYFSEEFPPVNDLPYNTNGCITFGCLNRLHKISDECFATWAQILKLVPNSRIVLKSQEFRDEQARGYVLWQFMKAGIEAKRVLLTAGEVNWYKHVGAYNAIDIALDPFPHGGGVTAMEGLMMGVPAVSLRWPTLVGRLSASILSAVGLQDWIADTANDYVQLVIEKALDIDALAALRPTVRERFLASCLGNRALYVAAVEARYRELWQRWCEKNKTNSDAALLTTEKAAA